MIRLGFSVELQYQVAPPGADFIFNLQAAQTRQQRVLKERLDLSPAAVLQTHTDAVSRSRYLRLSARPGPLLLRSAATVELQHHVAQPSQIAEVPVRELPPHVLPYLYPSRYCESDRLGTLAMQHFGALRQGYMRVAAIRDWVQQRLRFRMNSSDSTTSACDTINNGVGVCRDFAHVMISLCRALNIPARFATGFDYGADPALGPPDFHAYVEAYLGHRWYLFDASGVAIPMAFVRLATSRDAGDAAFATIFGKVDSRTPTVRIDALPDDQGVLRMPHYTTDALSTDDGQP
jgi:transglutaminase-like putative cysteine protease